MDPRAKAEERWGWESCLHPVPIPTACTPACTTTHPCLHSYPYPLPAPVPLPASLPAPLAHIPSLHSYQHPCLPPGSGCGAAAVPGLPAGASEAAAALVICWHKGAETPPLPEQTRAGQGWAVGSHRHLRATALVASLLVAGRGAGWHCPHAQGWGCPPRHPNVREPRPRGLPRAVLPAGACCTRLCTRVCSPTGSVEAPRGVQQWGTVASGAHPCTLLGWSPPGLGVGQEETKPKLSC